MDSFKQYVRIHFEFLYQFGYRILEESSDNIVSFQGESNRLDVEFSEIGYEITCHFIDNENKIFSLQDAILYMPIGKYKGLYQVSSRVEIEKGVICLSKVIKILFDKIDISNHLNFDKIFLFKVETHEKALKDYYLKTDIRMAEEFWERKEYTKAQELFDKHKDFLTKSQFKKLEYIKNHTQTNS